jgi:hypothetical protein
MRPRPVYGRPQGVPVAAPGSLPQDGPVRRRPSAHRSSIRTVAGLALGLMACGTPADRSGDAGEGDDDGTAGPVPRLLALPEGLPPSLRVTATFKWDAPGTGSRALATVETTLDAAAVAGRTVPLPEPETPPGASGGPTHLHVTVGAPGAWRGVAVAALPGEPGTPVEVLAYRTDCDADGDGHYACRGDCCDAWPALLRPSVLDCLDDAATALRQAEAAADGRPLADAKRRRADLAHAFRPLESAVDYFECENGLDEACVGSDVACQRRRDADQDGTPVALDCDDADPAVRPEAMDPPGDGVDQNCDGRDAAGTDRDFDGFTVEGRPADCDDTRPEAAPGHADAPCDGRDDDCDGTDPCPPPGLTDADGDGAAPETGDCDDEDPGRAPGRRERCGDGTDQDCDGVDLACAADDADGDGFSPPADCDDADADRYPGAPERCDDTVDQDCDGRDLPCALALDRDADGYPAPGDCADRDPARRPGAPERCNGLDEDCDGVIDEGPPELDASGAPIEGCRDACGPGRIVCLGAEPGCRLRTPTAEVCNGRDDDCDGTPDDGLAGDVPCYDGPAPTAGVGSCRAGSERCAAGVAQGCKGQVLPAAIDVCDGTDDDCDGAVDESPAPCYDGAPQTRGVGICHGGVRACTDGVEGPCIGQQRPTDEVCNGLDDDCDGPVDEGLVEPCEPGAGVEGPCSLLARTCVDGRWDPCLPMPEAGLERCDGLDDDCDGLVDEGYDLAADARHCGACGRACGEGAVCCDGDCFPGPLCRPAAPACSDDTECPADAPRCAAGRCAPCDPADQSGCAPDALCCPALGAALACLPGNPTTGCEACGAACEPGAADRCTDRTCRCGDGPECVDPRPFCHPTRAACVECLTAVDCENALGGAFCVDGSCRPCDGETHDGCGPQQLCCGDRCVASNPAARCGTCATGCAEDAADRCLDRACACGDGPACDTDARPFCADGRCAACRDAADCGPGLRCDDTGACAGCGPAAPCPSAGPQPVCEGGTCRPCEADAECVDPATGHQCVAGRCGACDPADGAGCLPGGAAPTCDAATRRCRACADDAECPGDRPVCREGRCRVCDAEDHAGCDEPSDAPVCDGARCMPCRTARDCAARPGVLDQCFGGRCVACHPGDGAGCDPAGAQPICDVLGHLCRGCRADDECRAFGAGTRCLGGACAP